MKNTKDNLYSNTSSALVLANHMLKTLRQNEIHCFGHKETSSIVSSF